MISWSVPAVHDGHRKWRVYTSRGAQNARYKDLFRPVPVLPAAASGPEILSAQARTVLLVALFIRTRAPPVGGPIVFQRIFISLLGLFQGLDMLKFSTKFAGNSRNQNTRLCISDIYGPIESKLDM